VKIENSTLDNILKVVIIDEIIVSYTTIVEDVFDSRLWLGLKCFHTIIDLRYGEKILTIKHNDKLIAGMPTGW